MFKKIGAREQFKSILISLQTTSHPWLTWKDTINNRALNNNTGTIHLCNLCTEISLPQDGDNVSVCNLASINLSTHLAVDANGTLGFDWARIDESARSAVRQLDNLIDITRLVASTRPTTPTSRTAPSASASWASPTSSSASASATRAKRPYDLIDEIMEHVSYAAIDESRRPGARARHLPELRGLPLVAGPRAVRLHRAHRGRPRRADQGRPHDAARLGRAARQGQGRHAQRDAHGDRADGIHRPRRRHHARPRPAVLADLQPRDLERQVPRGEPQPGERPAEARHLGAT